MSLSSPFLHTPPAPDGPPRLFAMVSTAKSRAYTPHALRSFFETTGLRSIDSFILINNDDPELSETIAPYRGCISLISHEHPQSFSANANLMIEYALSKKADLFFMNNDIIFTDNWLAPCVGYERTILSPISNREVQLAGNAVVVKTSHILRTVVTDAPMELQDYLASPRMFQALAEANAAFSQGLLRVIVYPFFCVRLPLAVMQTVGKFDVTFGRAGGEDYDYCCRAWLAGFDVQMAVASYLIHFWGKSTWSASTSATASSTYNTDFLEVFKQKWGEPLFKFILQENDEHIVRDAQASALRDGGDLAGLIKLLMPKPVDIFIP
jgi:hypothetical protein